MWGLQVMRRSLLSPREKPKRHPRLLTRDRLRKILHATNFLISSRWPKPQWEAAALARNASLSSIILSPSRIITRWWIESVKMRFLKDIPLWWRRVSKRAKSASMKVSHLIRAISSQWLEIIWILTYQRLRLSMGSHSMTAQVVLLPNGNFHKWRPRAECTTQLRAFQCNVAASIATSTTRVMMTWMMMTMLTTHTDSNNSLPRWTSMGLLCSLACTRAWHQTNASCKAQTLQP